MNIVFCCCTKFHILMSYFIRRIYFPADCCTLLLTHHIPQEEIDMVACSVVWHKVVWVKQDTLPNESEAMYKEADYLLLFSLGASIFHPFVYTLGGAKKILAYDGITTYQLEHWNSTLHCKWDLSIFSEIWVLDKALLLDSDYSGRCNEIDIPTWIHADDHLEIACRELNAVFRYSHHTVPYEVLFMDRYLSNGQQFISLGDERYLVDFLLEACQGTALWIKRHPSDVPSKYAGKKARFYPESTAPWELIYLNRIMHDEVTDGEIYITYNSAAPYHGAALFGKQNFTIVLLIDILDKYASVQETYLNSALTKMIFSRIPIKYEDVKVISINNYQMLADYLRESKGVARKSLLEISDAQWENVQRICEEERVFDERKLKAFRLRLSHLQHKMQEVGNVRCLCVGENRAAIISKALATGVFPHFQWPLCYAESLDAIYSEGLIDCAINCAIDEYTEQPWLINGYGISPAALRLLQYLNCDDIYLWGAYPGAKASLDVLIENGYDSHIRGFIDSHKNGEFHGYPIFPPDYLKEKKGCLVIICAVFGKPAIVSQLKSSGMKYKADYIYGIGAEDVD